MVTTVLASVATMSKPEVVLNPLLVKFWKGRWKEVPRALSPFKAKMSGLLPMFTS